MFGSLKFLKNRYGPSKLLKWHATLNECLSLGITDRYRDQLKIKFTTLNRKFEGSVC